MNKKKSGLFRQAAIEEAGQPISAGGPPIRDLYSASTKSADPLAALTKQIEALAEQVKNLAKDVRTLKSAQRQKVSVG